MIFRDNRQRARICRALLTTVFEPAEAVALWTESGPTDWANYLMLMDNIGVYEKDTFTQSRPHRAAFELAWSVWGAGRFSIGDAVQTWPWRAWRILEDFSRALGKRITPPRDQPIAEAGEVDHGGDPLEDWLRHIEQVHGWGISQ